ncbi:MULTISPECIES: DNA helicase II [unclassified Marinobacterium]|jgi:DNA helicase II / ATP-dependent DNA helicase PcrA|uniref:DNA helicase II n=1 Tax=unclassified Marinobacterium TaxID=2644139 RepID=UPI0015682643|nr:MULTISPECIES: DNA helicase II [unclassified Marinobacterium]NRP10794.1 DNA helicase II [Marinobacterium sp. xm-g-48]NRP14926.1 DNA helicase II [Marinobacterium sp. xm-a-152]NRP27434.1 DNA helicase II [Marinobacterium sp. xm-d-420]NRP36716.1 DNA helicase II [Marinobacterium sp. xm-d-579]NRP38653.1 DNA helicase II [Marinobacterium sp. xm-a-121]
MDVTHIIDSLNDAQREAVTADISNLLVLAGAGSGKTRVLVHRIAWLIEAEQISPYSILAVTFTNKAAKEMRGRIESLLNVNVHGMWVGTFHGLAHRLLRSHWQEAGLRENFQIMDSDDQLRLVKRISKEMGLDDSRWPPKQIQWYINAQKDEGLRSKHLERTGDLVQDTLIRVYEAYEQACDRGGMIDFGELLLRCLELLRDKNPQLLQHYKERFRYVLVDEFQDTNAIQYAWLRLLCQGEHKLMAVGDDDQSIYGWRGARIENIQNLEAHFGGLKTIKLEQNYRSTDNILSAANAVIRNNFGRLGKELWTEGNQGDPISLYAAFNEQDEARFIVDRIAQWVSDGNRRDESAILYRSNAQSRVLEEMLIRAAIPYRIYGGQRFYERLEIKNALAYLRLIANRDDDTAMERVINVPTRGIGTRTIEEVRDYARSQGISMWRASNEIIEHKKLPARAGNALQAFLDLVNQLTVDTEEASLQERTEHTIRFSGLIAHHEKEKGEKAQSRIENLEELVTAARQFEQQWSQEENPEFPSVLAAFLDQAALDAGESQADPNTDSVQLMTLHSAKGLEFPLVFLCGMEEGLFPHSMSAEEPGRLEEERRLCYVGITRAMQKLYMTYAESRRLHGQDNYNRPSRFIQEIPLELIEEVRLNASVRRPLSSGSDMEVSFTPQSAFASEVPDTQLSLGQRVNHPKFGDGMVINFEGSGPKARVQVNFDYEGTKWLVVGFANLTTL